MLLKIELTPSLPSLKDINVLAILPDRSDDSAIRGNFSFLVGRILRKHMPFFKSFGKGISKRIRHEYSCEMGKKSEVVDIVRCCLDSGT